MEDKRFALPPAVVNHFTQENDVIATVKFSNHAADKVSCGALQERAAFAAVAAVHLGEAIRELRRKSVRKMVLIRRKDINCEMARLAEIRKLGGGSSQAPQHKGRIERDRCERIDGEPHASAALGAPSDDRDASGKLAQGVAKIPVIEGARSFHG